MIATPADGLGLMFFSFEEAGLLEALVARIVPGDEADPGAREAGVLTYIDRALAGPYAEWQHAYREGLRVVDAHVWAKHGGALQDLPETEQDAVLAELEVGTLPGFAAGDAAAFFAMVWAHTIEGMFGDPAYGGNRDAVGWRLIGFPGAQYGYAAEQMTYGADLSALPIMTLADVRRLAQTQPELFYRRPGPPAAPSRQEVPAMPSPAATVESGESQGG